MSQKQPHRPVLTTEKIAGTFRCRGKILRHRYAIPVAGPLDLPETNLPVHPYVLGAWLGDGNSCSTQITTHGDDLEIADNIRAGGIKVLVRLKDKRTCRVFNLHLDPHERDFRHCRRGHDMDRLGRSKKGYCAECARQFSKASQYGSKIDPVVNLPDTLSRRLRKLSLLRGGNRTDRTNVKHIPPVYLRASIDQRLALLQGLMDTDGTIAAGGRCEFTSVLPRLAEGFGELLSSLGIKHTARLRRTSTTYLGRKIECQPAWRFSFLVYDDKPVFRLKRKLARQPGRAGRRTTETERRRIVDVQPVPSVPVRCIQVDSPSRLFLAGQAMIPTHNTEILLNTVGFHVEQDPAPIMVVMPTERDAETWSKDRFSPMARDTPCLKGRIPDPRSRDGTNKILHKKFPGGHLTVVGANAPSGLASRPIRILLCDEVDRYPFSAGAEGDPVNLAKKRTVTFWNRKIVLVSTPTLKGASRIESAYEESDRRRFWVPCPACGAHQVLVWPQVRWERDPAGRHRAETARYECLACNAPWSDAKRWAAIGTGEWRAEAPFAGIAGFHLNEIYSSWVCLEAMVRTFLSAREQGDEAMKTFVNTSLGETWVESGEAPDWQRQYERRETWPSGTLPAGALFLTAGADVQKDRIEVDVWAWGRGLESWLIDHIVIEGGPENSGTWAGLDGLLGRTWRHAGGTEMGIARLAIDTGYESPAVYAWARRAGFGQVAPVKGVEGFNRASPVSGPTWVDATEAGRKVRRGARLWTVAVSTFKSETYRYLRLERPTDEERAAGQRFPAGTVHLPSWADGEWVKQLVAEQLVTVKTKRGFQRLEWQKLRERNEALDCRTYARAAAWILGADRWAESKWRDLEKQACPREPAGVGSGSPAPGDRPAGKDEAAPAAGLVRRPLRRGRKVFRSSYMA